MSDFAGQHGHRHPHAAGGAVPPRRVVVIGGTELARRVCGALHDLGDHVVALDAPSDADLHRELDADVTAVAVLVDNDIAALRYALAVEHIRPHLPLFAAIFDRTVAQQLVHAVPTCHVMSPADLALPSLTGACLDPALLAVTAGPDGYEALRADGTGLKTEAFAIPLSTRIRGALGRFFGQLRPYDGNTGIMLAGLVGLLTVLLADIALSVVQLRLGLVEAIFHAVRTVATVGPAEAHGAPSGYKLLAAAMMLATIVFTAVFTAGIVNRLLEPRLIGLLGSRTLPRAGHVIVVGLGQVGLRLCEELRRLGVPVVAVERNGASRNVRLAQAGRIPVVVGDAGDRFVLDRLVLRKARALVAVASDDLENVAVAVTARAVSATTRVVIRAGDHDAIAETRSLFAVGHVCDVNALSAVYFTLSLHGRPPAYVFGHHHDVIVVQDDGSFRSVPGGHDGWAQVGPGVGPRRIPRPRDGASGSGGADLVPGEASPWRSGS